MKKRSRKSCFTLIELLVVIAIIAILAAILLPALNSARERGIQTDCSSRLKSVGAAINMYRSEYNDMIVSQNAKYGAGDSSADANWISILMQCKYISGIGNENSVSFVCPVQQAKDLQVSRGYGIMTYMPYNAWSKKKYAIDLKTQCVQKMGESKILLVSDSGTYNSTGTASSTSVSVIAAAKAATYGLPYARHNNMLNGLLLDGHVESATGEDANDKFTWIRITWSSGESGPYARTAKIPFYINKNLQVVTLTDYTTVGTKSAL